MSLLDKFGPQLHDGRSMVPTLGVLQSAKFIALYFSAHWCGPCRGFTPMLTQANGFLKSQGVQVIFVSSDNNEASFHEYYSSMPWKAVPYSRDRQSVLQMFGVQGIPKLVLLSSDGRVITTEGVELLKSDPTGQKLMSALQPARSSKPSVSQPVKQYAQPVQQFSQYAAPMMQMRY